jgi:hypothetical protein
MQVLYGLAVYSPNGGQHTIPTLSYNERAAANASMVPVAKLTWRYPRSAATSSRWTSIATDAPPSSGLACVHRLQLGVRVVELLQRARAEHEAVAASAEERDGRVEQSVEIEGMDVAGWRHAPREGQVPSEQGADVLASWIVRRDQDVTRPLTRGRPGQRPRQPHRS